MSTVDVAKVMAELSASIRKARAAAAPALNGRASQDALRHDHRVSTQSPSDAAIAADIASLHYGYDIVRAPFYSHRGRLSRAIIALKNFSRELMMQILVRQVMYNGANTRVVTHLQREIESLRSQLEEARAVAELEKTSIRAELQTALMMAEDRRKRERDLILEPGYFLFEQEHRGSETEVAERQRTYVARYKEQSEVLDIGCGRGEFLQLLREAGISHQGVDANPEMVAYCRRKGLEVVRGDALEYLKGLPEESLGGVFCAQMIEHLEPARVIKLVQLCHSKLRAGGVAIFETPNPGCLMVFAESFYKDLTHIRPYHPASIKFLLESSGFERAEIKYSAPVDPANRLVISKEPTDSQAPILSDGIERLNELLYGFQDYAVIAKKRVMPKSRNSLSDKTQRLCG
jgi:2-polyprenyl-3-methyl-5-hydroxy-6-metoxy-1,4-benzoquinol methylase